MAVDRFPGQGSSVRAEAVDPLDMQVVPIRTGPSPHDEHEIVYFRRHPEDDPAETVPGRVFLRGCPVSARAQFAAVLVAVATAPPYRFAGGGYWEAMRGEMKGYYEVRKDGPKPRGGKGKHHYRLFCRLDHEARGRVKPLLVVLCGKDKPFRTVFTDADYAEVRALGAEYLARNPRSIE